MLAPLLSLLAVPAQGAPALRPPTGKWVINYAEHQCTATRAFGTADKPLHLVIKPSPGGEVTQIALLEKGPNFGAVQENATLDVGSQKIAAMQLTYGIDKKRFRLINLAAVQAAALSTATTLRWSGGQAEALDLGPMTSVIKVLENCRRDLRRYWNIEPELRDKLKTPAKPAKMLYSYFSSEDYPAQAHMKAQGGTTGFILLIDEQGRMRDCMVEQTSGIATLDIMSCLIFAKRAKFAPAVGADGKPVRGSITTRVRWVMPER